MSIMPLPNELLSECFAHCLSPSKGHIKNLRLVSRQFYAISSPFLITRTKVNLDSKSLDVIENLSVHPIFSRSITHVTINASYYDKAVAGSLPKFAENCASNLYQTLEYMERAMHLKKECDSDRECFAEACKIPDEWDKVGLDGFEAEKATAIQKLLMEVHGEYVKLYDDQERVWSDGGFVGRLIAALKKFPTLKSIATEDQSHSPKKLRHGPISYAERLSADGHRNRCLSTSPWKGSFRTALYTEPPVQIIPDLFTALADSKIRPKSFEIKVTTPFDLRCLRMTNSQLDAIKIALSQAEELYFRFSDWARRGSFAENNDRPRAELEALCELSTMFFSSPSLKEMELSLGDYPCFYEVPTISLADLLPLPLPSSGIGKIYFKNVPFNIDDLKTLVQGAKKSCRKFIAYAPYLLDGERDENWTTALDLLRGLEGLEYVELKYMNGGCFGDSRVDHVDKPKDGVLEGYVLGREEKNPLLGWVPRRNY